MLVYGLMVGGHSIVEQRRQMLSGSPSTEIHNNGWAIDLLAAPAAEGKAVQSRAA